MGEEGSGLTGGATDPQEATAEESRADGGPSAGRWSALRRFGRYIVLGVLGEGGMGVVLKGYDDELDRQVAIKVLHERLEEGQAARLRREAQAMAKLSHPNVVQVYEVGRAGTEQFVAMELCKGQTLRQWQNALEAPHEWKECVRVYLQVGRGLAAAHAKGLVHRDFKPGNAIIDPEGRVRVLDFGLARQGDEAEASGDGIPSEVEREPTEELGEVEMSLTKTGAILGTPAYMPPEQMWGAEADTRSDQFSFCVALYEAVYGERPFEGSSLMVLRLAMQAGQMRAAPKGSKVPVALRNVLVRGLAFDPAKRWPSMEVLLDELQRLVAPRIWRWVVGVGVVVVAVGSVVTWRQSEELSVKDGQLTEKEAQLAQRVVELEQKDRRLTVELAKQKGLRARMLAEGDALQAVAVALEAFEGVDAEEGPMPASVLEGLPHALAKIHGGIALRGHTARVVAVAVSPDGQRIATASEDQTVRLWDAHSGAPLRTFEGHVGPIHAVALSPDGRRIASASKDQTVRIWDVATAKPLESLPHQGPVRSVAFSPEGTRIATASGDVAWVWHEGSDALVVPLVGHTGRVRSVAWSPDGTTVLTASEDETAHVWEPTTGAVLRTLEGHTGPVYDIEVSRDGARIVTASRDQTARLWDAATGQQLASFEHDEVVYAVALSPDGARLATGTFDDGTARVWDLATGRRLTTVRHDDAVVDVAFSPFGHQLVTASWDGMARSWDLEPNGALVALPHARRVDAVAYSPDGSRVVTGSGDGSTRLWDARSGAHLATLRGHRLDVLKVAFSPDGSTLASASWDGSARLWDVGSGTHRVTLRGHTEPVRAVAFSPDGSQVATASRDGTARVWNAATGEQLQSLSHEAAVVDVMFDPSGQRLLTIDAGDTAQMWSIRTGEVLVGLPHEGPVTAVAFSPDGRRIAAAIQDALVHTWDAQSGERVASFLGHTTSVRSMTFSRDGTLLATGSEDGTARVWDTATGTPRIAFPHEDSVTAVAFSPDGKTLATASGDDQARLWSLETGSWVEWGCQVLDGRSAHLETAVRMCTSAQIDTAATATEPAVGTIEPVVSSAEDLETPEVITVHGVELVLIPGGTFMMGSPPGEPAQWEHEGPQHEVTLDAFYLARTPVTNAQYALYLQASPDVAKPLYWEDERCNQPEQPVVALTWYEAKEYCDWAGLVLPREAQWEYAARAGTTTAYWFGDGAEDYERFDWCAANSGARDRGSGQARAHSVAAKGANPWGLFDMHGNVRQWTLDVYGPYTTSARVGDGSRQHPLIGDVLRVVRGANFGNDARDGRSASRDALIPDSRWSAVGLRPARGVTSSSGNGDDFLGRRSE